MRYISGIGEREAFRRLVREGRASLLLVRGGEGEAVRLGGIPPGEHAIGDVRGSWTCEVVNEAGKIFLKGE